MLPGVVLPSGRVVIGEYLLDPEGSGRRNDAPPGRYPVHATLARYPDVDYDSVALATLVVSGEATVRWEEAGVVAVDGGSTSIVSAEGAEALLALFERDEAAWLAFFKRRCSSRWRRTTIWQPRSRWTVTLNLIHFSSGIGDGGYPVLVGYDAAGRPTRIVVDFLLLHLDWPGALE